MSANIKLMLIFVICPVLTSSREVPKLSKGHALIGDTNMQSCGYLSPKHRPKPRIIDGDVSELGEFPWHVAIYLNEQNHKKHLCGGALIHQFWILTAKQCFHSQNVGPIHANNLIIGLGSIKKQEFFITYSVLSIFEHSVENLTLLRLEKAVTPIQTAQGDDYRVNFVCLPMQMIINEYHEDAIVSGFGYSKADNRSPNDILRKTTFLVDPSIDCDQRNYPPKYICATASSQMTCFEDIGSPLVQFDGNRAVLIGIVQPAQSLDNHICGMGIQVFYRVSHFIGWIKDYIISNVTTHLPTITTSTTSKSPDLITTTLRTTSQSVADEEKNINGFAHILKTNSTFIWISIILSITYYF